MGETRRKQAFLDRYEAGGIRPFPDVRLEAKNIEIMRATHWVIYHSGRARVFRDGRLILFYRTRHYKLGYASNEPL